MTDHYSPMSITQLIHTHEEPNQAKDVQLTNETPSRLSSAPGTLNGNPKTGITLPPLFVSPSTASTSPLPTPTSCMSDPPRFSFSSDTTSSVMEEDFQPILAATNEQEQQQPFINRVSNISLVNSALRVYERSTAQNVMKYGSDMVESFTGPIYDKFGKGSYTNGETQNYDEDTMAAVNALARTTLTDELDGGDALRRRAGGGRLDDDNIRKTRSRPHSRSTSPHRPYVKATTNTRHHHHHPHHPRSKVNKSKWQQIVMHAGSAAGTTAAVVSEESMKCLRYCLHWLQYATQHIQQQMHILRNFLVSLATSSTSSSSTSSSSDRTVSRSNQQQQQPSASTLAAIQKEIILTLRKVVEVVSRYAGVGLPTHAKASVRSFILQLPGRWATLNNTTTPSASPSLNRTTVNMAHDDVALSSGDNVVPDHVKETSIKLLNFGGESVEMLESVSTVFSDSIDRAEVWLDRLRVVGVAPGASTSQISRRNSYQPVEIDSMET